MSNSIRRTASFSSLSHALAAVVAGVLLASCAGALVQPVEVRSGMVLRDVNVVNTRDGSVGAHMAVVIAGGKIQQVVANEAVHVSGTATVVDAAGNYVVPGYLDMHTHAMPAAGQQSNYWPLLIANGVTGIREMAGSPDIIMRARQLNADSAAGRVDAPEVLLVAGPPIAGVPTPEVAKAQVRQHKAMGAGFIKFIAGNRDVTLAIISEAKVQGLEVAGHLTPALSAVDASDAGWRSVEHLGSGVGILLDCSTDEAAIRQAILNGEGAKPPLSMAAIVSPMRFRDLDGPLYQRVMDTYSLEKCVNVARTFAKNDTWQAPSLIRLRAMDYSDDKLYRTAPELAYVSKGTREMWEDLAMQYPANVTPQSAAAFRQYYGLQEKLVLLMKQSGVKMLASSDLGGIWLVPGFSLHQEFKALAAAGLTPLDVLQMTTLNGAQFLHREADMGTVEQGKNANLVVLQANPLESVDNLGRIGAVILNGKYFSKDALEKMKSDVATAYRN
jgi:hypothetical protein